MNNNNVNLRIVGDFFNLSKIKPSLLGAFLEFLDRMPVEFLENIQHRISCIDMANIAYKTYKAKCNLGKDILIGFGDLSDLQHTSTIGLIAHLFALIYIRYHENSVPAREEWLKIDLYSDEIARGWGFKSEVEDLRKIRPQKVPVEIKYVDMIIEYSVHNKKFNTDICSILDGHNNFLSSKTPTVNKIWYIDRFSMICNLRNLRENGTNSLHIFTNKYTREELESIFSSKNNN